MLATQQLELKKKTKKLYQQPSNQNFKVRRDFNFQRKYDNWNFKVKNVLHFTGNPSTRILKSEDSEKPANKNFTAMSNFRLLCNTGTIIPISEEILGSTDNLLDGILR